MKPDKFGRFVDIWDIILNLVMPVKEPVKHEPLCLATHLSSGMFYITLTRGDKEGEHVGLDYHDVYAKALLDLEENENAS